MQVGDRVICVDAKQVMNCVEGERYVVVDTRVLPDGRPMVQVRGPGCKGIDM